MAPPGDCPEASAPSAVRATPSGFEPSVRLLCELTAIEAFSGGAVALAADPRGPRLAVSVLELGKVLFLSTETSQVLSVLDVPGPFEDGPKSVAFDPTDGSVVLLVDDRLTRWREQPGWTEVDSGEEASAECECLSVDGAGRVLLDTEPPCWLPAGGLAGAPEPVGLEPLPAEPPKATDGDLDAVYRRAVWEATTVNLACASPVACADGSVFFYDRESRSAHHLPPGAARAVELSVRQPRLSRGQVVHMESELPEEGCCCTSPGGGMFVVGACGGSAGEEEEEEEEEGGLAVWAFAPNQEPLRTELCGFRRKPEQLDAVAADAEGRLYLCVVERWPNRRAIYRAMPAAE